MGEGGWPENIPFPFKHQNKVRAINPSASSRYHTRGFLNGDSSDYNLLSSHFHSKCMTKEKASM